VDAIKGIDSQLKVGGPATADNAWVSDFLAFCRASALPVDFVTTHQYPTDAFGQPGDDTEKQLSESKRSVLRDEAREVRNQAGTVPVYYTEWSTSSNPFDAMHDDPYAAAFIVKTVLEANGLVQGYSYWTFSDIFEENYFSSVPFHGGFGLLNIHGIAKPAYRAYELLHGLGTELIHLEGVHSTVDAWLVRGARWATLVLTNYSLPRHLIATESVSISLKDAGAAAAVTIQRIDLEHANAKRRWEQLGRPEYLTGSMVAELDAASRLQKEVHPVVLHEGILRLDVIMPPQSVAAIEFAY
jgi:xylan 1,4-beta-xylosidase